MSAPTRCLLITAACLMANGTIGAPVRLFDQKPVSITNVAPGVVLVDFGRVAFGNLKFTPPANATSEIKVHFGEAFENGRINRQPPGTVRYAMTNAALSGKPLVVAPAPDKRNTEAVSDKHPPAILTPAEWGVVLPLRWVEIEGWPGELTAAQITRQSAFAATWDDNAAAFDSSDAMLNQIWELCRYSIKATTFAGLYVDGDRERIPYEADAYLNQISHYYTDHDTLMARDTFDHLMKHGTWPSEWSPHMVFMAYADWMHTGDVKWLAARYDALKKKLLMDRVGEDGLVQSEERHIKREDIVDWPVKERDGYVFTAQNTVVNAFHLRALKLMADMGRASRGGGVCGARGASARGVSGKILRRTTRAVSRRHRNGKRFVAWKSFPARVRPRAFNEPSARRELARGARHEVLRVCRAVSVGRIVRERAKQDSD